MPTITSARYSSASYEKVHKPPTVPIKDIEMISTSKFTVTRKSYSERHKMESMSVTPPQSTKQVGKVIRHVLGGVSGDEGHKGNKIKGSVNLSKKAGLGNTKLQLEGLQGSNKCAIKTKPEVRPVFNRKDINNATNDELYKTQCQKSLEFDPYKIYNFGEENSGVNTTGRFPQDFHALRQELLRTGKLFEDPQFLCNDKSIYLEDGVSELERMPIIWRRPSEIVINPKFFVDGISRSDIKQGEIGNCWFVAAISNLTMNHAMFNHVVPTDQSFDDKYVGLFHFRFWQYGRWIDICIDDRLPTRNGQLVFMRSGQRNEFWSALLEKAHCKLHGNYEATAGGGLYESLVDLTGGICETILLTGETGTEVFQIIKNCVQRCGIAGSYISTEGPLVETLTPSGLVMGQGYSVTKAATITKFVDRSKQTVNLVRLRNPWGSAIKWRGAWSDNSPSWNTVSDEDMRMLNINTIANGEFWMEFKEFIENFSAVVICTINSQSLINTRIGKNWDINTFEGSWVNGVTAGGCRNFIDTFSMNPQYQIVIKPATRHHNTKSTVIIGLTQKNRKRLKCMGHGEHSIGLALYKINNPERTGRPLTKNFFLTNLMLTCEYVNMRELVVRFKLEPGTYCIIPSTYEPHVECDFLLRVYSERRINMGENDNAVNIMSSTELGKCMDELYKEIDLDSKKTIEEALKQFDKIAKGRQELNWTDIKAVAETVFKEEGFAVPNLDKDIYRNFIAMFDSNHIGKMSRNDWLCLWNILMKWTVIFSKYANESKQLEGDNLRNVFKAGGITVNFHILNRLIHRFGAQEGFLTFESFLICAVKLESMLAHFNAKAGDVNEIFMDMHDLLETTICV